MRLSRILFRLVDASHHHQLRSSHKQPQWPPSSPMSLLPFEKHHCFEAQVSPVELPDIQHPVTVFGGALPRPAQETWERTGPAAGLREDERGTASGRGGGLGLTVALQGSLTIMYSVPCKDCRVGTAPRTSLPLAPERCQGEGGTCTHLAVSEEESTPPRRIRVSRTGRLSGRFSRERRLCLRSDV